MNPSADRGFVRGGGMLSPTGTKFLLSIPKNASSFLNGHAVNSGWTQASVGDNCNWDQVDEMIVVLRDPVDRWISGITQYLMTYIFYVHGPNTKYLGKEMDSKFDYDFTMDEFIKQYNQLAERLIFDNLARFDDHVWPQHLFTSEVLGGRRRTYFYIDQKFSNKICQYLDFDSTYNKEINTNSHENSQLSKDIQMFIKERLKLRPTLVSRIKHTYHNDYELIKQVIQ